MSRRAVVFSIYEMITRHFHSGRTTGPSSEMQDVEGVQHHDVTLDRSIAEYRALLNAWVKVREEGKKVEMLADRTPRRGPGWGEKAPSGRGLCRAV